MAEQRIYEKVKVSKKGNDGYFYKVCKGTLKSTFLKEGSVYVTRENSLADEAGILVKSGAETVMEKPGLAIGAVAVGVGKSIAAAIARGRGNIGPAMVARRTKNEYAGLLADEFSTIKERRKRNQEGVQPILWSTSFGLIHSITLKTNTVDLETEIGDFILKFHEEGEAKEWFDLAKEKAGFKSVE